VALSYQRLSPDSAADAQAYQSVFEQAPGYFLSVEGRFPAGDAAKLDLLELPPGKSLDDKHSFLIMQATEPVGCMEIVQGYPAPAVAYIGLLLFAEPRQGQGLGREALTFAESLARTWSCSHLRLAVISTNVRAFDFWRREGFEEIERKTNSRFTGEAVVMQRRISSGC